MARPGGSPPGGRGPWRGLTEEEKKNRPKLTFGLIKRVLSWLKPYRLQLFLVLLCITAAGILSVVPSLLTGQMIDEGLYKGNVGLIVRMALLSLGVMLVSNLISACEVMLTTWIGQHVTYDMRNQMYRHLQQMSHRFYTANLQGDIITRMTEDIGGVQAVIASTFTNVFNNAATVVIVLITLLQKNWALALIGVATIPFLVIPTRLVGKKRWQIA
ncbi:MAG: ABC transporter ATP-binding protein, partial [Clostridia bacterium]|nr:ABC transporter ATP-binding protein [Clostridia bacterium]